MGAMFDVYFATNRDFKGSLTQPEFGNRFNDQGPQCFRVGTAKVERVGDKYLYKSAEVEAEDEKQVGSQRMFPALQNLLRNEQKDILIFLHGFASEFKECLERAAQLSDHYRITPRDEETDTTSTPYRPIAFAFSWPSNGKIVPASQYRSDRDDAQASGIAMARALVKLLNFLKEMRDEQRRTAAAERATAEEGRCNQRIHLVAHSMGNWALRHAVNRFADEVMLRPLPRIFEHVFLMAADEDDDALEVTQKLRLLSDLGKFIHVYHSQSDRALDISDLTKGNPNRLGEAGPRNMDIIDDSIEAIDCSRVDFTDIGDVNHQYYRLRPEVINDVRQVISGVPTDRIKGRIPTRRSRSFRIRAKDEG